MSIRTFYGKVEALKGLSLHVKRGEIVAMIGANGAGKTTTINSISGIVPPAEGSIIFEGREITGMAPEEIVRLGISQVPEGKRIFAPMTVRDNLLLGAFCRLQFHGKREVQETMDYLFNVFPVLKQRSKQLAGTLSGGEQQMLAIARALMARPKLLLLDEPSIGLAPQVVMDLFKAVKRLREEGMTIFLVEQNASLALRLSDRGYVIETGRIVFQGTSEELMMDGKIRRAYLGKDYREKWER